MAVHYQVVIDCTDPHRLAPFWADALGYVAEDNSRLIAALLEQGVVTQADVVEIDGRQAWLTVAAIRDPDAPVDEFSGSGRGGRILFQRVPEEKKVKNRVHLDLHVGERRDEVVAHLVSLGATVIGEGKEGPSTWKVLADPEGNEFCVAGS